MSTTKLFTNATGAPVTDDTNIMTAGRRGPALLQDIGINFKHIPINAPQCPFHSYHRDGKMRTDSNLGRTLSFNPNSDGLWDDQADFAEPPLPIEGEAAHRDHYVDDDHWEQPGNLFRLMTLAQQQSLFENTARAMSDVRPHIKECRPRPWAGLAPRRRVSGTEAG